MKVEELIDIGLTKNQAEIYLELLKNPSQTAGKLAKKLTIDRSFCYGITTSLVNKGLLNYIKKEGKRVFFASSPENFLKDFEEKKTKLEKIVEDLKKIKESPEEENLVNVYEGKDGLRVYVRDFLESDSFCTLGGNLSIFDKLKFEYKHYLKELNKKNIEGKIITSVKNKESIKDLYSNSKVKIKALKEIKTNVNFTIFKNKIAIYSAEETPYVIIIKNKNISEALKLYFDELWKN
ncbi:hypothetical protein J4405_02195 [Candidatus Woesearchaeota archaeon]|nr:hypothetical protein [Candidatus Woesearchaeota archaeon]